jgi:hypothetical protein
MKVDASNFFKEVKKFPEKFFIVHYSSQSLFDEGTEGLSPRITSIVVMHYATRQTVSFAVHTVAELLGISRENVESRYDEIEKQMLASFFDFLRDGLDRYWVHRNMRNITYGFEHLEHRSRRLGNPTPPILRMEQRLNLNEILNARYGWDYSPDPKMKNLLLLNGPLPPPFLDGAQEAAAFKAKEFIRMHASTICKVAFFRHVIILAEKGKLRTASKGWGVRIDRLLESRTAQIAALAAAVIGVLVGLYQVFLWLSPIMSSRGVLQMF